MSALSVKGKKVALIGGAGFIGHNLALELKRQGAEVSIVDSLQVNNLVYLNQTNINIPNRNLYLKIVNERLELLNKHDIKLYIDDAREYMKLSQVLGLIQPQVVVLLAAVAHADRSNKDPYSTFDHSLRTLENALDYSRTSVEHFLFFSSSMVYGNFTDGQVDEETLCNPIGIYGALKYGGEKLVIAYNQVFNLPYTIIRPSALYGERCISRRVSQIFIENAIAGKEISVKGDGSERLDFTYIDDLVQGIIKCIANPKSRNQIFNLTYGESRSLNDLLQIIKKNFPKIKVNHLPKDKLMPDRGTLSVKKAKELIGYHPDYPVEKGYEKYLLWYLDNYSDPSLFDK